jgi:putative sterol carrier protein
MSSANFKGTPYDPARFFDQDCPGILRQQAERCKKLGGVYMIQLTGDGGATWTLDFQKATISRTDSEECDLFVEMSMVDFSAMMRGQLDVRKAAQDGRIKFEGDPTLFRHLGMLFENAG